MRTYKDRVEKLLPHQYFVFGSNTEGRHGKGAALIARLKYGAVYGKSMGFQGNSYAIVTKNLKSVYHPSISRKVIEQQIKNLYVHARNKTRCEFLVAYGCGEPLNGYTLDEMAKMFAVEIPPENIVFEKSFARLVKAHL